jgi:hypothetical protein
MAPAVLRVESDAAVPSGVDPLGELEPEDAFREAPVGPPLIGVDALAELLPTECRFASKAVAVGLRKK